MAKRNKKTTDDEKPEEFVMVDTDYPEPPMPTTSSENSDLLLILAVLAHHNGINAVEPSPEDLAGILSNCEELGYPEIDKDMLKTALKKAQIELLRRQLQG